MKRYEQILEIATRNRSKEAAEGRNAPSSQLKSYIVGHLNQLNLNIAPLTMKLVDKAEGDYFRGKKRCQTEMHKEDNLLFTFYPKDKQAQEQPEPAAIQEPNPKKLELRSFSLKNSPIVDYPLSNKILPRVFRLRTEGDSGHFKRSSDLSFAEHERLGQLEDSLALKDCNR
jgi:hypothetical protein